MNHKKSLALLGEISGITLYIDSDGNAEVTIVIGAKVIPVINTFHGGITHQHVTRLGIMGEIDRLEIEPHD